MKRVLAAAISGLFVAAVSIAPAIAQPATAPATTPAAKPAAKPTAKPAATTAAKPAEPKKLTAQQQKMKDCAVKWKDHKATTGEKGRDAYRKFLSVCLKGSST